MESLYNALTNTMADVATAVKTGKQAKEAKDKKLAEAQKEQEEAQAKAQKEEAKKKATKAEAQDLAVSTYLAQKGYSKDQISMIMARQKTGLGKDMLVGEKQKGHRRQRLSQIERDIAKQSLDDALLQRYFGKGEITEETLANLGDTKAQRQANLNKLYGGKQ